MKYSFLVYILIFSIFANHVALAQRTPPADNEADSTSELRREIFHRANPNIRDSYECAEGIGSGIFDLKYLGQRLYRYQGLTIQGCVNAIDERQAHQRCGTTLYNVINPGNPEYHRGDTSKGTLTVNNAGYYYCIPESVSMISIKRTLCGNANIAALEKNPRITFTWNRQLSGGDGACACTDREGASVACPDILDPFDDVQISVLSEAELQIRPVDISAVIANLPPITIPPDAEQAINQCVERWRTTGNACVTEAQTVSRECENVEGRNQASNSASDAIGGIAQGTSAARAGQGTQRSCFNVGLAALGAREVLQVTRERCQAGETFCNTNCQAAQIDIMVPECVREAGFETIEELRAEHANLATQLETAKNEVEEKFSEGANICSTTVPRQRSAMDRMATDLGNTLRASTQCACQTDSANPGQNCESIPAIDVCQANPLTPGCRVYEPIATCAPGSAGYDARICGCVQNPSAPGCNQVNGGQGPPTFAGATQGLPLAANLATGGAASFGGGAGGGSAGGGSFNDLSSGGATVDGVQANLANNLKAGEVAGAGASGGGGGGGSAGGGASGGAGAAVGSASGTALAVPEKKDGLGGLFKDVKNAIGNALGLGKNNRRNPVEKTAARGTANLENYKPRFRGEAQKRVLATANEKSLFQLVNECTNGIRCKSTINSFMVEP